jgi:hypothetical protein
MSGKRRRCPNSKGAVQDDVLNERTCIQDTQEGMTGVASPWKSEARRAELRGIKSKRA